MGVEEEEKVSNNSSFNTPNSWRSKGVSTDEIAETHNPKTQNNATELSLDDGSPPSSSSTLSEKTQNGNSQRFEECDSGVEPATTRHSVLLQLIACGSSITNSTRNAANVANGRKSSSLHKGVLCKTAAKSMNEDDEINYMSENPRFGNPQSEEKEYFSGSIVESMTENRVSAEPALKKSSSYNEERYAFNLSLLNSSELTLVASELIWASYTGYCKWVLWPTEWVTRGRISHLIWIKIISCKWVLWPVDQLASTFQPQ